MLEYPRKLPGLTMTLATRMKWAGVVQTHASGSEARLTYWDEPLWEWDLDYDMLRDGNFGVRAWEELSQIEGLFAVSAGTTYGFKFWNDRANSCNRQPLGTSDGSTTTFDLIRTYGAVGVPGLSATEHIGLLDDTVPFQVYLDDAFTPTLSTDVTYGWSLNLTKPGQQQLIFNSAPDAGHIISVNMGYFFYTRFALSPLEYDRFLQDLYSMKKVTLASLRAETL